MRKIFAIIIITTLLSMACGGCMRFGKTDDDVAEERFLAIVESIKNKDKQSLKKMFSDRALSESKDIDNSINRLFEFFVGNIVKYDLYGLHTSEHNEYGDKQKSIDYWLEVETTKKKYLFYIFEYTRDDKNYDNIGLYTLRVILEEDKEEHWGYIEDMEIPGIYVPE